MAVIVGAGATTSRVQRSANLPASTLAYAQAAWVKATVDDNSTTQYIFSSRQAAGNRNEARFDSASTNTRLRVDSGVASAILGTANSFPLNTWFYVGLTTNGTNLILYFWNEAGTLVASDSSIAASSYTPDTLGFASRASATTLFFQGKLCYMRCWNGNMTQAEFETNLTSPTGIAGGSAALLWNWKELTDDSGNAYHPTTANVTTDSDFPSSIVVAGGARRMMLLGVG